VKLLYQCTKSKATDLSRIGQKDFKKSCKSDERDVQRVRGKLEMMAVNSDCEIRDGHCEAMKLGQVIRMANRMRLV
jgi:hypothetical protein